jgi:hypothetical protein
MRRRKKRPDSSGLKTERSVAVANCSAPLTPTPRAGYALESDKYFAMLDALGAFVGLALASPEQGEAGRPTGTAALGRAACRSSRKTPTVTPKSDSRPPWCRFMVPGLRSNSPAN